MFFAPKSSMVLALIVAPLSFAKPIVKREIVPPPACKPSISYTVTDQHQYWTLPTTAGTSCQSTSAGCSVGLTEGYAVGISWTAGGSLGLSIPGITASIAPSWSYSTTTSTSDSSTANCPDGPWSCGLAVTASMLSVSGQATGTFSGQCSSPPPSGPYTLALPIINRDGNADVHAYICTCPDLPGADVAGAPTICPSPCGGT